jgi:hypothetical protein
MGSWGCPASLLQRQFRGQAMGRWFQVNSPRKAGPADLPEAGLGELVQHLDVTAPKLWDMVGVALWTCEPPVCMRLEFQYIRLGGQKVVYLASGTGGPRPGRGLELQLTKGVARPEDYTGAYLGVGLDVKVRGLGCGTGMATSFPWGRGKPVGVSVGLSSPGPTVWLCDYLILGAW